MWPSKSETDWLYYILCDEYVKESTRKNIFAGLFN